MQEAGAPGWLARHRQRIVDRAAEQVLATMASRPGRRRAWSAASAGGWALSTLVHASTAGLLLGGVLVAGWTPWIIKPVGVLLTLVALAVTPRPSRRERGTVLRRPDAPHLFGLLDEVAVCVQAPVPREVEIVDAFNAFAAGKVWRTLGLGSAVWMLAPPQARVALLGHELGHFAHGDLLSLWWVSRAEWTLLRWRYLLDFSDGSGDLGEEVAAFGPVLALLTAPFRGVVSGLLYALYLLNASSGRRQEYLADLAGIESGGTDGARELLEVLLAQDTVEAALTRAALTSGRPDPWGVVDAAMAAVDATGRANRRVAAQTTSSRLDDSHPTTWLRLRLVDEVPRHVAQVVLDSGRSALIDAELQPAMTASAGRLTDDVRYTR